MKSTILLAITENQPSLKTIGGIIESNSDVVIITNKSLDDNNKGVISAFLKSCCDGGVYTEEKSDTYEMQKKEINGRIIAHLMVSYSSYKDMMNFAVSKFVSDIYITASVPSLYSDNYVQKYKDALSDPSVGAVYSDYFENDKPIFLQSMNPMLQSQIRVRDIGFKRNLSPSPFQPDNASIIKLAYQKSIIRHIPEQLFKAL